MEVIAILLVALIVLGPAKLPEAARQVGKAVTELRRVSSGFQRELREAVQDPILEAEAMARGADLKNPTPKRATPPESEPTPEPTEQANTEANTEAEGEAPDGRDAD